MPWYVPEVIWGTRIYRIVSYNVNVLIVACARIYIWSLDSGKAVAFHGQITNRHCLYLRFSHSNLHLLNSSTVLYSHLRMVSPYSLTVLTIYHDHDILVDRLQQSFGFVGVTLT